MKNLVFLTLALLLQLHESVAFSVHRRPYSTTSTRTQSLKIDIPLLTHDNSMRIANRGSNLLLQYSKDERPNFYGESEKRGAILLSFVMLLCVWSFSIPVELRRDHLCFTEKCASNRSSCYDCITIGEWYEKISEYYAGGGGVNFDFSVEQK